MIDPFIESTESYLATITQLFTLEGAINEVDLLAKAMAETVQTGYDNWNGGTNMYTLYLQVPISLYTQIIMDKETIEGKVLDKLGLVIRDDNNYYVKVVISPELLKDIDWREKAQSWIRSISDTSSTYIDTSAGDLTKKFSSDYINNQIETMIQAINNNPHLAIGTAKELLEACCKTILDELSEHYDVDWDIIRLVNLTCDRLRLTPKHIPNEAKARESITRILGNLANISQGMAELRNPYGSGHGKSANFKGLAPRHARLVVGSAITAVLFLWETFEERNT
ncbi:MAG TPA: abortive infection family protein [Syntrophomonadaceae bacterium]|nr:abortive infection family protein [Syntrophomonadaceae bacterium]